MVELTLPSLLGLREAVTALIDKQGVRNLFPGVTVTVYCRELESGSPSAADQLVKEVLEDGHAECLVLVAAPRRFVSLIETRASKRGFLERIRVATSLADLSA